MKLIFTEYLASLKERGELDVIMPDLLSEIGLSVISRPAIGTKQYGVDVVAVGDTGDGIKKIFLLSVKPGDLRRSGWNTGAQALRPSLDQIQDVYIPKLMPARYKDLPVVVVLCLGGDLHEDVRVDVEGYMAKHKSENLSFALWNGDILAGLLLSGVLRENALPETWRSDFRKSVALVDEPDVSFGHFCRFVAGIANSCKPTRPARLTAIRQIYIGLWTLYVWAREASNTEAAYLCGERAVLMAWHMVRGYHSGPSGPAKKLRQSLERLVALYQSIADDYITSYIEPRASAFHGLTSSIRSDASLDVNLRMFDLLGRVGTRGLWTLRLAEGLDPEDTTETANFVRTRLQRSAQLIADMISNNPVLRTPIKENQAIDINIACLFLERVGCRDLIRDWIRQVAHATIFAFRTHEPYPCIHDEYRKLIDHPQRDDAYRTEATIASLLVPILAVWAAITEDTETLELLADFASDDYAHSNLQLWYPASDTEEHLYSGSDNHGASAHPIRIPKSCEELLSPIMSECETSTAFLSLSAVEWRLWPLVILACRHHRVPVPPHFWFISDQPIDGP